ncbi:hypothetical protein BH10BAC5_BH10BAC5_07220 [soil metagenome]
MQKPSLLLLAFLLSICFLYSSNPAYSQESKISTGTSGSEILSSPIPDPQVSEVIRNLKIARINGDMAAKEFWENKLNELTHPQIISQSVDNFIYKTINSEVSNPVKDLNLTKLSGGIIIANSVSRERFTGQIYAALGIFGSGNDDTLKIYRSVDNGIHFTLINTITAVGLSITRNNVDIEAVSQGDSTFAFVGMSYIISGTYLSVIYRVREDGLQPSSFIYPGTTTKRYVNMRITSDNSKYLGSTYIYVSVVLDSIVAGARNLRSKLGIIKNPFGHPMTLTSGYQEALTGRYAYYVAGTAPDSATFETDIAYVNNTGDSDQVYTLSVVRGAVVFGGGSWLAFTRSNDYGATAPATFTNTTDTKLKERPRIASTGFSNNSLMCITRRLFGGGDWDPYYFYSAQINAAAPTFTSGFVDSSSDTTYGVSVAGLQRGNGSYLFAFNNLKGLNTSTINIRGFNNNVLGFTVQSNPVNIPGTNIYGIPDAGFRNVNNDSCFVLWAGDVGIGSYVTGGCGGTFTGVGNNTTEIKDFRLDQNYPNPFNPTTNISYNIPSSGSVKIVVYDVLGSEVATVLNENKTAGYYSTVFDGKNLASGAYYYKITFTSGDSKSFSQTKKMLLIK